MMYKIQTLNKISEVGLSKFTDQYTFVEDPCDIDAILLRSYKMHDMELPKSLKAVGRAGAGVNNIPIDKCSSQGIVVFNTPGANANAVKELVLAGLLLASRRVARAIDWAKTLDGKGEEIPKLVEKGKSNFTGSEIQGKKLGVIGLGAIGVMVANAADALGMEVYGYDPFISVQAAWGLSSRVNRATSLDELLQIADYITIHVPLVDSTKDMINKDQLNLLKKGVKILNFSRGGLVNDDAVLEGISTGVIDRYVTDFPSQKILMEENVVCIPHLGASTPESEENCAVMVAEEVMDYLENGNITNSVNYPNCNLGKCSAKNRVTVNHQNIPNMVGQITTILANANQNISDMINKSKGNYAYTVVDVEDDVKEDVVASIKEIQGVLKVRVLK